MGVQADPAKLENEALAARIDKNHARVRAEIARLAREASVLRNRSQITARTRDKMNSLSRECTHLAADLPETRAAITARTAHMDKARAQFALGHQLYRTRQAPALADARSALHAFIPCALPPPLERQIIALIAEFDRYATEMSLYSPSRGVPAAMARMFPV